MSEFPELVTLFRKEGHRETFERYLIHRRYGEVDLRTDENHVTMLEEAFLEGLNLAKQILGAGVTLHGDKYIGLSTAQEYIEVVEVHESVVEDFSPE